MEIEVYEDVQHPFRSGSTTGYRFKSDHGIDEPIGTVTIVHEEGLVMAFNINPKFHSMGLGRKAFNLGFGKYSKMYDIKYIKGSWLFDLEFGHLEHGQSTNLTIYKDALANGLDQQQAALSTSTGKWACSKGYDKVLVLLDAEDHVEVEFYKELLVEPASKEDPDWLTELEF